VDAVRLSLHGTEIRCNPITFLGGKFNSYLDAVRKGGARYNPSQRCNIVPPRALDTVIRELSVKGFEIEVDPELAEFIELSAAAKTEERKTGKVQHDAAIERMDRLDVELAKRGMALYPFQRDGVRWLSHRSNAGLFDEMGLGKTVQALISAPEGAPIIVIAPAAVKGVWKREAAKWRSDLTDVTVLAGRGSFRWPEAGEMVIINYDILPAPDSTDIGIPNAGTVVIFDEVHALKNAQAKRTKAARVIRDLAIESGGKVWGLTGTPLVNRPNELWNVLKAIGSEKEAFGSWRQFRSLFDWAGNPRGTRVADALAGVSLMRRRTEVLPDLPTKTYTDVSVPIDAATRAMADELVAALLAAGVDLAQVTEIAQITAAAKADAAATSNAQLDIGMISRVRASLAAAKLDHALSIVEQHEAEEQALVVFSSHRAPIDAISAREGWARLSGSESPEKRTEIVSAFQAGQLKGVACTIRAAGVGLTLTHAHHALFVDNDWTPGWCQQAEDRICRIGQDRGVQITTLVAEHVMDERVHEILAAKGRLIETAVNASARTTVEEQFADAEAPAPKIAIRTAQEAQDNAKAVNKAQGHSFDLTGIWDALAAPLGNGAKRITFTMPGLQIKTGEGSYKGKLKVTDGKGWPNGKWYGVIEADGTYRPNHAATSTGIPARLVELAKPGELIKQATQHGLDFSYCCFCSTEITHPDSLHVGYGPVCAKKWNLPHGKGSK